MKLLALIGSLGNKLLDLFSKKSKNGEKSQDIEIKKVDIFHKAIYLIIRVSLIMCILASLFPSLAIPEWWFNIFEETRKYIMMN